MTIKYSVVENSGLAKNLLSKHLDKGFIETFFFEAASLGKKPNEFDVEAITEKCKDMSDNTLTFMLALEGEEFVGVLAVHPDDPREIQMLWVEEPYRKRKVASKLIDLFKRSVSPLPLKVECLKGNVGGLGFYKEQGFEFVDKARYPSNLVGYTKVKLQ